MKKLIAMIATVTLLAGVGSITAFAHGHGAGAKHYSVCNMENCNATGTHQHHGQYYTGHHSEGGRHHRSGSHH